MEYTNKRLLLYNEITYLLNKHLPSNKQTCLNKYNNGVFNIFNNSKYIYSLNNYIFLIKQIGNKSRYGTIYLSKIQDDENDNNEYYFITKIGIITEYTLNELLILNNFSNIVKTTHNRHLPLIYNDADCNNINTKLFKFKEIDKYSNIKDLSYYLFFIELEDGDLYDLFAQYKYPKKKINGYNIIFNIFAQVFVSIAICHYYNVLHNDIHPGNFLYRKDDNNIGNCVKYIYKGLTFYIEHLGYIIKISDFGISSFISNENKNKNKNKIYKDYKYFIVTLFKLYCIKDKLILTILNGNGDNNLDNYNKQNKNIYNYLVTNKPNDITFLEYLIKINILLDEPIGDIIETIELK